MMSGKNGTGWEYGFEFEGFDGGFVFGEEWEKFNTGVPCLPTFPFMPLITVPFLPVPLLPVPFLFMLLLPKIKLLHNLNK